MDAMAFGRPVPVTRLVLKTVEARRYQDAQANTQIRVDHNSNLSHVRRLGDDEMEVEFGYTTSYGPLGLVKVEGVLALSHQGAGSAADEWTKTRNLPPELAQQVHGAIMSACVPEAVGLAKTIRLPPPIPLPQIRFNSQGDAKAGGGGASGADQHAPEIG